MQRNASRSQFLAADPAGPVESGCFGNRTSAGWMLLATVAFVLAGRGLAAAEPDNVLLDFTAKWCGPCQQMSSIVSKLERQGQPIRKVDVDQEPQLASKYGVTSIPCFVLVGNGQEIDRVSGLTTEQQLKSMLNRLPKTPAVAKGTGDGPSLGQGIPITPAPRRDNPRNQFASDFDNSRMDKSASVPAESPTVRGQPPEANPLRSSVRIRVKDGTGINFGSGTIIESQPGKAIIVSCGHIFRRLPKSAVIEIDVYSNPKSAKPETIPGTVLLTDMEADVSLVSINYPNRLPSVRLSGMALSKTDRLFSIGCSGGDNPSREDVKLITVNRYDGPDNLECSGRPQKGRSGGGLFRDDELVGVCFGADPKEPRGTYAGLQPVAVLLEKAGLAHLAPRNPKSAPASAMEGLLVDDKSNGLPESASLASNQLAAADDELAGLLARELNSAPGTAGAQDLAGAEIICIVRSRTPGKPSRVVIVNQASERFVADLLHESVGSDRGPEQATAKRTENVNVQGPVETSFEPKPYRRVRTP